MTVEELISHYHDASGDQARPEDARHATWWIGQLGPLPVTELTHELISRNVQTLTKRGRSNSTVRCYLRFLRRVCRWGVQMSYLTADPCETGDPPRAPRRPLFRVLSEDEEQALCAALGEPYSLWVRFAIVTGLKQSEQFALRWRDVDLAGATLFLPDPYTRSIVALSLSAVAVALLRDLQRIQPVSLWVFPDLRTPARPANVHAFYTGRWETAIRRAGIPHVNGPTFGRRAAFGLRNRDTPLPTLLGCFGSERSAGPTTTGPGSRDSATSSSRRGNEPNWCSTNCARRSSIA